MTLPLAYLTSDDAFDALFPPALRRVSGRFWTPLAIARRAAELLATGGATRVMDVGSGVGKFALVAAATVPTIRVVGVEQRGRLVEVARRAQDRLCLENVSFVHGNASELPWKGYDGFYFYNSFAENLFDRMDRLDDEAELSITRFGRDVHRSYMNLRAAPVGTAVVTFHGSSGRVPATYALRHVEPAGSGFLRLWKKGAGKDDGAYFVEVGGGVEAHPGHVARRGA